MKNLNYKIGNITVNQIIIALAFISLVSAIILLITANYLTSMFFYMFVGFLVMYKEYLLLHTKRINSKNQIKLDAYFSNNKKAY